MRSVHYLLIYPNSPPLGGGESCCVRKQSSAKVPLHCSMISRTSSRLQATVTPCLCIRLSRPRFSAPFHRLFLRPRFHPKSQHQFGQVLHARPLEPFLAHSLLEDGHHAAALLVVAPKIMFQPGRCRMVVHARFRQGANFFLPELSFVTMTLPVIKHSLLPAIEAHGANVRTTSPITTAKNVFRSRLNSALHSPSFPR